jgi:magnesium transporter
VQRPKQKEAAMIIDCALYKDGKRQHQGPMSVEEAAARQAQGGFVWVGMYEPTAEELDSVRKHFGLHELAVEDVQSFHLRPKVEQYEGGVHLVILRTARYDEASEEVEFGEISIFIATSFVITVRQGVASELHGARERLERRPRLLRAGTTAALWAIFDQVIDSYTPVVAALEQDIEEIERTVFSGAVAPTERIYFLRREVTDFYRAVHPLLAATAGVEREPWARDLAPYFRDVRDHLMLVNEEVSAQRDLLTTVLEANMAVISVEQNEISVRQNATMQQLTVVATVFLPLSFVVGFFGQNFAWMEAHMSGLGAFIVLGIGGLILPVALLLPWLRYGAEARASRQAADPRRQPQPARREAATSR